MSCSGSLDCSWSVVFVVSSFTGCINFGIDNTNNGFFVLIIIDVVAMYIGNADKISIPKTKPGKPRKCA